jgi:hypothetical protein
MLPFSIILPTRERVSYLRHTIKNIIENANNSDNFEIIVIMDTNDAPTLILQEEFKKYKNVFVQVRVPGDSLVEHYINWSFQFTKGKYIMVGNDDALFKTKNWDTINYKLLEDYLKDKPDGIVCAVVNDGVPNHIHKHADEFHCLPCSFPILSRKAIEALGFILDPRFVHASADLDIIITYTLINRVLNLRNTFDAIHMDEEYIKLFGKILLEDKRFKSFSNYVEHTKYKREWVTTGQFAQENASKLRAYINENK